MAIRYSIANCVSASVPTVALGTGSVSPPYIANSQAYVALLGPASLTGAAYSKGGYSNFNVENFVGFSYQIFVTGSVNGIFALQQSTNLIGWVNVVSQSLSQSDAGQTNFVLANPQNTMPFARIAFSASSAGAVSASVTTYVAGNNLRL